MARETPDKFFPSKLDTLKAKTRRQILILKLIKKVIIIILKKQLFIPSRNKRVDYIRKST